MTNLQLPIEIREAYSQEHNFIYNSWIKSGYRSRTYEQVAKEIYTLNQHDIITHILGRANVLVAQEIGKPESLYGYIIYQVVDGVFLLHYAYTKQMFRNLGVFKSLILAAGFNYSRNAGFYTHTTKAGASISAKFNLFYNPFMLINPKYDVLVSAPKQPVKPAPLPSDNIYNRTDLIIDNSYSVVALDSNNEPAAVYNQNLQTDEYTPQANEQYDPQTDPNHPDYDPDLQYQETE